MAVTSYTRPNPDETTRPHIVLVGTMATGKTSVGQIVAERLGRPLIDSDQQIQTELHLTVESIETTHGIKLVHALESEMLKNAIESNEPSVIAAAGSVVETHENRELLRRCEQTVWLRIRADTALDRAKHDARGGYRPDFALSLESMSKLITARSPLYAEVASIVIDADDLTLEQAADQVLQSL